jgi:hypothetical protein
MGVVYREIPVTAAVADRLFARSAIQSSGCVEWIGPSNGTGYGYIYIAGSLYVTHRVSYILAHGPIPSGLQLDHLCRNTMCLLPEHLEAVTPRTNLMRSSHRAAITTRLNRCTRGHEFTPDNTYTRPGKGRECKACKSRAATCALCGVTIWAQHMKRHLQRLHSGQVLHG